MEVLCVIEEKKLALLFVIILVVAASVIFAKIFFFKPLPTYSASDEAFDFLTSNPEQTSALFSSTSENTCYWITPSYNGTNYLLEIREYDSPTKDCVGTFINQTDIVIDKPGNIMGDTSCICGGKEYLIKKLSEGDLTNFVISGK